MIIINPLAFWLLLTIPIILYVITISWKIFDQFLKSNASNNYLYQSNIPSWQSRYVTTFVLLFSYALIIIALAQPCILKRSSETVYKNVRLFFLLDVSLSMSFAEDIKPNRLAAAKKEIKQAVNELDGVYPMCLIPFAGVANSNYCPLTTSKSGFFDMLNEADFDVVEVNGTNVSSAFTVLNDIGKKYKYGVNLCVLISDGGKEDGVNINFIELNKILTELKNSNFKIYTVGIGLSNPTPLISRINGEFLGYYKDEKGNTLYSSLDENTLKKIGQYARYEGNGELAGTIKDVITKNRIVDKQEVKYENVIISSWFYGLAAVLLFGYRFVNYKALS